MKTETIEARAKQLLAAAKRKAKRAQEWTELHNAVYGIGGKLVELFPTQKERLAFSRTAEARAVNELIDELQSRTKPKAAARQNGTIIVRLPASIHTALSAEAEAEGTSLNQLCLAKLSVQLRAVT
jgi:predicted HicB family RNase H-like nuclease